jgi:hypothetical protein
MLPQFLFMVGYHHPVGNKNRNAINPKYAHRNGWVSPNKGMVG